MKKTALSLLIALSALPACVLAAPPAGDADANSLSATLSTLDGAVFDAFNHCGDPVQLQKHASHFADDVEFYHDTGGVTWTRDAMLANTRKNACGHYTRELIAGSFKVYPIKDFGALAQGTHRFCQTDTGKCEGLADFAMVWRLRDGQWRITRVLSYGHRATSDE